jgi:cytoskeletal protein RodZ
MRRQWIITGLIALFLLQTGCGAVDGGQSSESIVSASTTSQPADAIVEATATSATAEATRPTRPQASHTGTSMDRTVIERAVVNDLAKYLNVTAKQITVTETDERTWPDQGLGCNIRQGVFEPAPTPGYLIRLKHNDQAFRYHTDRQGSFLRCMDLGKPMGPITR